MRRADGHVDVVCLIRAVEGQSVLDTMPLLRAIEQATHDQDSPIPRKIRLRMLRDRLLRRGPRSYTYFANGVGISPSVLDPATDAEVRSRGGEGPVAAPGRS